MGFQIFAVVTDIKAESAARKRTWLNIQINGGWSFKRGSELCQLKENHSELPL